MKDTFNYVFVITIHLKTSVTIFYTFTYKNDYLILIYYQKKSRYIPGRIPLSVHLSWLQLFQVP